LEKKKPPSSTAILRKFPTEDGGAGKKERGGADKKGKEGLEKKAEDLVNTGGG